MDSKNLKIIFQLLILVGGIVWWMNSGFKNTLKVTEIHSYIESLRGHDWLSIESTMLVLTLTSLLIYPIAIWFILFTVAFSQGTIDREQTIKSIAWAIFSPILFISLIFLLFSLRVITSLVGWLVVLFIIGTIVVGFVRGIVKIFAKK